MEVQAAVIQIDGTDHGLAVIAEKNFCMDEAGRVFVDLYTGGKQLPVVAFGQEKGRLLVWNVR